MGPTSVREYIRAISKRYATATAAAKRHMLDEFCATTGYHRKSAIRALSRPPQPARSSSHHRGRPQAYGEQVVGVLAAIWEAAGYPWSTRLKALLPLWLPWAKHRFAIPPTVERQLLTISHGTIDRRLQPRKRQLKRRLYGLTKPGTLLKHQIPIKTERWETTTPGFVEVDLVSHSGNSADGEFLQSLNVTDIHSTWVETRAVLGKGQLRVRAALEEMQTAMPFALQGLDSDNGAEFINAHLFRYCQAQRIQFTRGRPYKKDDNAHIEQKNWTHVRKLLGYDRYDSLAALEAINDLYRNELRLMMNLFQPSVKLLRKVRVGSKVKRVYDAPRTPLNRLLASPQSDPQKIAALVELQSRLDPFALAATIDWKLSEIYRLANHRQSPRSLSRVEREAISTLERMFESPVVGRHSLHPNLLPHR